MILSRQYYDFSIRSTIRTTIRAMDKPLSKCLLIGLVTAAIALATPAATLRGRVTDPQGQPVANATVLLTGNRNTQRYEARSASDGTFEWSSVPPGDYRVSAATPQFQEVSRTVHLDADVATADLQFIKLAPSAQTITVSADAGGADIRNPDPAQRVFVREEILDANPGRPGAPVSLPGLPIETASSGIKAPQYFAPGVAGDHGEPIATFIQVGSYLLPNNLSANAHGNGYSDPNIMVPAIIEGVQTDGGSFNVREGNHSVDLAETYGLRSRLEPFATVTADYRDVDVSAGWNWLAMEAAYGNGFLDTLEHRQQYKLNALKGWNVGAHHLSLLFLGYYGTSRIPGLVPVGVPNLHDTIDPRQKDQTHTGELAVNDVWRFGDSGELQLSGFFRTYNLALDSNFGDGLIRQSEFRTEAGGNAAYIRNFGRHFSIMAGFDYFREAPRRDDLDHYLSTDPSIYGPFEKVTANNITLNFATPFVAAGGNIFSWLRYNLGWRRDEIQFVNTDLLFPSNSFTRWIGINSPKATLAILPPEHLLLPAVSFSFGESFFTNDPRVGTGVTQGSLISQAHAYQVVVSKTIRGSDFRVTLGHITQEASLAKIDPDTGLQFNEGPSRNRFIAASVRHYFRAGLLQASVSKADARDLSSGTPVPEAPRTILDVLGTLDRLPWQLHARAEFEEVGSKPLGDGFVSVPVREVRGALMRSFKNGKIQAGLHFQLASGYSGQTTEVLALPGEGDPFERVTGVYLPSYATASISYRLGR